MDSIGSNGPMLAGVVGNALTAMGGFQRAGNYLTVAQRNQSAAEWEAKQLEVQAGQQVASAQRQAMTEDLQGRLMASRALAVAAASGGGASDPTVMNLIARMAGEANYRRMTAMYEGEDRARQLRDQAAATRAGAKMAMQDAEQAKKVSRFGALTNALAGGVSLYNKYAPQDKPAPMQQWSGFGEVPQEGYSDADAWAYGAGTYI